MSEFDHLRSLPDGKLTRTEVGLLLDRIAMLEMSDSIWNETCGRVSTRLREYVDLVGVLLDGWEGYLDTDQVDVMADAVRKVRLHIDAEPWDAVPETEHPKIASR